MHSGNSGAYQDMQTKRENIHWALLTKQKGKSIYKSLPNFTCVLPTYKKICHVKKSSSPTIWHNSLAKLRSNLHQES
jgi:hypothetical protein